MKKEYAIINTTINDTEKDYKVLFKSVAPFEVVEESKKYSADENCIEIYSVDDGGEFADGSDYDTFDNFARRLEDKIRIAGKCHTECDEELTAYAGFRHKLEEIAGAVNAEISDKDFGEMWMYAEGKINELREVMKGIMAVESYLKYIPKNDPLALLDDIPPLPDKKEISLYDKALKMFYFND